jgi:hypothetical protein
MDLLNNSRLRLPVHLSKNDRSHASSFAQSSQVKKALRE